MESHEDKHWVSWDKCGRADRHSSLLSASTKRSTSICHVLLTICQATKYLLDPLNAPEPSEETGPGTHFRSSVNRSSSTSKSPAFDKSSKQPSVTTYPTPPTSASPTRSSFHPSNPYSPSHRQLAFGELNEAGPSSRKGSGEQSTSGHGRRRGSEWLDLIAGSLMNSV